MLTLPPEIIRILSVFAPLFSRRVVEHVQVLLLGAILTPGRRTVANALRVMGRHKEQHFQNYHRVLNRAHWSSHKAAYLLLQLLVDAFAPAGVLVMGIDETLERRQGDKIAATGIYRDAARSSRNFFVTTSGLRWITMMVLTPIAWAGRVWALPFLTVLAPSERYAMEHGTRHKKVADWARQMVLQVRRWLPARQIVLVADSGYAVLVLLDRCVRLANPVTVVTRLRLDAALYDPAPPRKPKQNGRPRIQGKRLPMLQQVLHDPATNWTTLTVPRWYSHGTRTVEVVTGTCVWYHTGLPTVPIRWVLVRDPAAKCAPQALVCTTVDAQPEQIVSWFVLRWQWKTTFQAVRTHVGVETQRQWNEQAILRTTPALVGLFSLVTLLADQQWRHRPFVVRQAAWYRKPQPTFNDALAAVRRQLWNSVSSCTCRSPIDLQKLQHMVLEQFVDMLCYAT
jgi:hypothetical protein